MNPLKQFADFRERADAWQIFFSENLGPIFIQLFAKMVDFLGREKFWQILIGSLPDLGAQRFAGKLLSKVAESPVPGINMELVGIDERAVDIEDKTADF